MVKTYRWTVDFEVDWGGRSNLVTGLQYGIPKILEVFKQYNIKAIFFISTELIREHRKLITSIQDLGHKLGSHGHFHIVYNNSRRASMDYEISQTLLSSLTGTIYNNYRAPKFSYQHGGGTYETPKNHISLLKYLWFGGKITNETIFYLHPFDIIGGVQAPNLFCKLWYSRPRKALRLFKSLCETYQ